MLIDEQIPEDTDDTMKTGKQCWKTWAADKYKKEFQQKVYY